MLMLEELLLSSVTYRRKERISSKYEFFLDGARVDNIPSPTLRAGRHVFGQLPAS